MSLAKYKMDKLIEGVMDKGYSRHPENYQFSFLWERLIGELHEIATEDYEGNEESLLWFFTKLSDEIEEASEAHGELDDDMPIGIFDTMKRELADLSNFIDFIFNNVMLMEKTYYSISDADEV